MLRLSFLQPQSTVKIAHFELELPHCISLQNVSRPEVMYQVAASPSVQGAATPAAGGQLNRVRLTPRIAGVWASEQRVLWLFPRISCAAPSAQTLRIRTLLSQSAGAPGEADWQELRVRVVPVPSGPAVPPKRLAPSLTWAPIYNFAPNDSAAGIAHSMRMFRSVGMTTMPQSGCRNLDPAEPSAQQHLFTPAQRQRSAAWDGLQYGLQLGLGGNHRGGGLVFWGGIGPNVLNVHIQNMFCMQRCFAVGKHHKRNASKYVNVYPRLRWRARVCFLGPQISSFYNNYDGVGMFEAGLRCTTVL